MISSDETNESIQTLWKKYQEKYSYAAEIPFEIIKSIGIFTKKGGISTRKEMNTWKLTVHEKCEFIQPLSSERR